MRNKPGYLSPCILLLVTLAIGLATFLSGCNSAVQNQCAYWTPFPGTIYKTEIVNTTCHSCIEHIQIGHGHNKRKECVSYKNYTCYSSYVWALSDDDNNNSNNQINASKNKSCNVPLVSHTNLLDNAEASIQNWRVGEHVNWYNRRGGNTCISDGSMLVYNWYTGVIFLSLVSLPLYYLFMSCMINSESDQKRKNVVVPSTPSITISASYVEVV
jgi:hypothetical protein